MHRSTPPPLAGCRAHGSRLLAVAHVLAVVVALSAMFVPSADRWFAGRLR